jgi:hypothetical protein
MAIVTQNKKNGLSGFSQSLARHPVLYGSFLVIIVAAGAFFGLITPAVRSLQTGGTSSVSDLDQRISDAQAKLNSENQLINALVSLSADDRSRIDYALPSDPDSPGLLAQVAAIVRAAGGTLSSVDFSLATDDSLSTSGTGNGTGAVDVSMNVNGMDYNKFKILLDNIEINLRIIDVKNFVFTATANSLSLNLRTYYRK